MAHNLGQIEFIMSLDGHPNVYGTDSLVQDPFEKHQEKTRVVKPWPHLYELSYNYETKIAQKKVTPKNEM